MWGFIVEIEKDEIDVLRYKNRMEVFSNRKYKLVINPTLECNFKCWYCYEKHPQGYMSLEVMEKCKKHIQYMVDHEKITSLVLDWFGGEPTLYFDEVIYPIGKYAKKICEDYQIPFYHYITTNASRINLNTVKCMKEIGISGFQITIDGDEKRHNLRIRSESRSRMLAILSAVIFGRLQKQYADVYSDSFQQLIENRQLLKELKAWYRQIFTHGFDLIVRLNTNR